MSDARHLKDLISRYWNLAYAEGKEGRTHDTLAGDAAACLHDIEQAIKALEGRSQPAQAVPLLTDEDIWNDDHIMGMNAFLGLPMETIVSIVRAAVPLVRSKLGAGVGWIACADQMPKPGRVVLACYTNKLGNVRRIRAQWVAAKTSESSGEAEYGEYDEATDTYYDTEGWYECVDNWDEYSSVFVLPKITHWQPLPPPPDNKPETTE